MNPPKMTFHVEARRVDAHGSIARCKNAEIALDTDEPDHRLERLHENVRKYGTVFTPLASGTSMSGVLRRK